jgi:hypothetical protein
MESFYCFLSLKIGCPSRYADLGTQDCAALPAISITNVDAGQAYPSVTNIVKRNIVSYLK